MSGQWGVGRFRGTAGWLVGCFPSSGDLGGCRGRPREPPTARWLIGLPGRAHLCFATNPSVRPRLDGGGVCVPGNASVPSRPHADLAPCHGRFVLPSQLAIHFAPLGGWACDAADSLVRAPLELLLDGQRAREWPPARRVRCGERAPGKASQSRWAATRALDHPSLVRPADATQPRPPRGAKWIASPSQTARPFGPGAGDRSGRET